MCSQTAMMDENIAYLNNHFHNNFHCMYRFHLFLCKHLYHCMFLKKSKILDIKKKDRCKHLKMAIMDEDIAYWSNHFHNNFHCIHRFHLFLSKHLYHCMFLRQNNTLNEKKRSIHTIHYCYYKGAIHL